MQAQSFIDRAFTSCFHSHVCVRVYEELLTYYGVLVGMCASLHNWCTYAHVRVCTYEYLRRYFIDSYIMTCMCKFWVLTSLLVVRVRQLSMGSPYTWEKASDYFLAEELTVLFLIKEINLRLYGCFRYWRGADVYFFECAMYVCVCAFITMYLYTRSRS